MELELLNIRTRPLSLHEFLPCFKQVFHGNDILITMSENNFSHNLSGMIPPPTLFPLLQKLKGAYLVWFEYYPTIPKIHRFTLGQRIDGILVEMIEMTSVAGFTPRQEKIPYVRTAIRKLDTARVLLLVLWETKSLDNKRYIALSEKLEEIGKMLGGWHGQLVKQSSPETASREP